MLSNIISQINPLISYSWTVGKPENTAQVIPKVHWVSLHSPPKHPGCVLHPPIPGFLCRRQETGEMREISMLGKPLQTWDTKAANKSNGMPDQMCSTFVKITKLSQEERFMCLLLTESFPRYFLSMPPKLTQSRRQQYLWVRSINKMHCKATDCFTWLGMKHSSKGWAGVSSHSPPCPGTLWATPLHSTAGSKRLHLTCHLQWTQAQKPGWHLLPMKFSNLCPHHEFLHGKIAGSLL